MQGKRNNILGTALALLLITGLTTSQSVLSAKDTDGINTAQQQAVEENSVESGKQDSAESTVTEKAEKKENKKTNPKIGRGGADAKRTDRTGCEQRKY